MSIPTNHKELVEIIMLGCSRFRGMAHSELGWMEGIDEILENTMPWLFAKLTIEGQDMETSPIIEACGRYLEHPTGIGFFNIITAAHREPALMMYLKVYQDLTLPKPDYKWAMEDPV